MDRLIIQELADAVSQGRPVVSATVVRTSRSVPRHPGSRMLVYPDGTISGTIGGGEMEHRVRREAAAALTDGRPRLTSYSLVDPSEGDPGVCGGEVDIYLEPHMPPATMFVVGAGHVGRAVADLAHWLGYRSIVWDDREGALDDVEHADDTHDGPVAEALERSAVGPDTSIIMVTRNVDLDVELMPHIVATEAGYIGLMGSQRRWSTTRARLVEKGLSDSDLERIHSPIGVEIQAETPEEIAVSIMAQVISHHRGS